MSGNSDYMALQISNWIKGTTMPAAPATVYAALWNGDPLDDASGGTEVTGTITGAGRIAAPFGAIAAKAISNSGQIDFGTADAGATADYFALFDNATVGAGNMIGSGALDASRTITTGDPVTFEIGDFTIQL